MANYDKKLDEFALERAAERLRSDDPRTVAHSAIALTTGELPNPDQVDRIAGQLRARMDLAPIEGRHPQDVLGLVALDAELDAALIQTQQPSQTE